LARAATACTTSYRAHQASVCSVCACVACSVCVCVACVRVCVKGRCTNTVTQTMCLFARRLHHVISSSASKRLCARRCVVRVCEKVIVIV
jgi:hypothetical protein